MLDTTWDNSWLHHTKSLHLSTEIVSLYLSQLSPIRRCYEPATDAALEESRCDLPMLAVEIYTLTSRIV